MLFLNIQIIKVPKIIIENQIRLTEDMLQKINDALALAGTLSTDTVPLDGGTTMAKADWINQTNQCKADYEKGLFELNALKLIS
jgi:hypothetical protein